MICGREKNTKALDWQLLWFIILSNAVENPQVKSTLLQVLAQTKWEEELLFLSFLKWHGYYPLANFRKMSQNITKS